MLSSLKRFSSELKKRNTGQFVGWLSQRAYSSRPIEAVTSDTHKARSTKVTINTLRRLYKSREPICVLTAHDHPSARFVEKAGIDICLVGDSLAMVALGYDTTIPISIEEMLYHCRAVARGAKTPFLIADMTFGSYEACSTDAVRNAIRLIKEGNMEVTGTILGSKIGGWP